MLTVTDYDRIRRAYHLEGKSMRQISRELGHGYWTIRKALEASEPPGYQMRKPRVRRRCWGRIRGCWTGC